MIMAYKVGTISEILASQSSDKKPNTKKKKQEKLQALFGSSDNSQKNSGEVFRTVKVSSDQVFNKKLENGGEIATGFKGKKKKENKVKEEADGQIPINSKKSKKKLQLEKQTQSAGNVEKKKKVKKKKAKKGPQIQDDTVTTTSPDNSPVKTKKKKKKQKGEPEQMEVDVEPTIKLENGNVDSVEGTSMEEGKQKKKKSSWKNLSLKQENGADTDGDDEDKKAGKEEAPEKKTLAERNAPKPKNEELEARTIFIGNLPGDTDKKDLRKILKSLGNLETVRLRCVAPNKPTTLKKVAIIKQEHHPDKPTVAAYARFSTRDEAKEVVQKARGMLFKDHHLVVDLAVPDRKKDHKKGIFVGNLDHKLKDEELWRFFEDCGPISGVRIVRDNQKGTGKGFGFVNFENAGSIDEALRKNNTELKNRPIRIKRCVKKMKVKKLLSDSGKKVRTIPHGIKLEKIEKKFDGHSRKGKISVRDTQKHFRETKRSRAWAEQHFVGDKLAEIGKLKRKSKKPNRGELRKNKIARMLTDTDTPKKVTKKYKQNNN